MERNHKPLKKSTVPMALKDGHPSKCQDESIVSTSFVDVLTKKLDAFYRLSRPYAWTSIVSCFTECVCNNNNNNIARHGSPYFFNVDTILNCVVLKS